MRQEITDLGKTYRFSTEEEEQEGLALIHNIITPHGLTAEMPPENMSRGNQGDEPSYTRVIVLKGPLLEHELLADISTKITNLIPVNRVLIEISTKKT